MIDWMDRKYPLTGFGDDTSTSIKFMVVRRVNDDDELAWTGGEAKLTTHDPHNSNDGIEQYHGRNWLYFTSRLWFRDEEALETMRAVEARRATLRYRWGLTLRAGGTKATLGNGDYLVLPDTTLVSLGNIQTPRHRLPEATATFRRAYGSGTLYDYAHYAEEEA